MSGRILAIIVCAVPACLIAPALAQTGDDKVNSTAQLLKKNR